jgi:hypothetical protein
VSSNGISTLSTKAARQVAKLNLSATQRTSLNSLRKTYDITLLPTQYSSNSILDNPNVGGLIEGRPWTAVNPDTAITVIETASSGATLILNLDARNTNSLVRTSNPGTWYDLTTNNNDATIFGTVAYGAGAGGALNFPGGDPNYVQAKNNVYFNGDDFTIQTWVYPVSVPYWNRIIDFGTDAGTNNILLAASGGTTGKPTLWIQGDSIQSSVTISLNNWHHVCATYVASSGLGTIYVDGQPTGSLPGMVRPNNVTRTQCYIGKSNWGNPPDPNFNGGMGAVQIYNGALTDAEILSNYNTTKSYYGL